MDHDKSFKFPQNVLLMDIKLTEISFMLTTKQKVGFTISSGKMLIFVIRSMVTSLCDIIGELIRSQS